MHRSTPSVLLVSLALSHCTGGVTPTDAQATDAMQPADVPDATQSRDTSLDGDSSITEPSLVSATYGASTEDFLNPERGWMEGGGVDPASSGSYAGFRSAGYAMVYAHVRLDAYRATATLPASFLTALTDGFARVRAAHIKVVLRFSYNDPSTYPCTDTAITGECADAAIDTVLGHVHQLGDILRANADVIAVVEAGFVGLWGEWHGSTHMLDSLANRQRILTALLAEVPANRSVLVRTPMNKSDYGFTTPLADAQAFDGSAQARIGHHNDCFLASDDDFGTYDTPVATWMDYVARDTRFVPMGGETCAENPPRSSCAAATAEMERLHWSFLNRLYHPAVVQGWHDEATPCDGEISRRLGYRFALVDASWSEAVRPGGVLAVQMHIRNDGYAALYNARPMYLVVDDGSARVPVAITSVDPRRWAPGTTSTVTARVRIPATARPGTYTLALWLPDDATRLRDVADYSVRFANDGVWRSASGDNVITDGMRIDASAGGDVDPSATAFVEIP